MSETNVFRVTGEVTIKIDMPLGLTLGEVETPEEAIDWVVAKLCGLNCGVQDEGLADELTVTEESWD